MAKSKARSHQIVRNKKAAETVETRLVTVAELSTRLAQIIPANSDLSSSAGLVLRAILIHYLILK